MKKNATAQVEAQVAGETATETATATEVTGGAPTPTATHDAAALRRRRESLDVSRRALAGLTGLPLSRVWAAEQPDRQVSPEHLALIVAQLDQVQVNGLPADLRPRLAAATTNGVVRGVTCASAAGLEARLEELARRLGALTQVLGAARDAKTVKDVRPLIERALELAGADEADEAASETGQADGESPHADG
jgi:transcriptional regulator with XRE-family HTH domain